MTEKTTLSQKKCTPCQGGILPLTKAKIQPLLKQINGWKSIKDHHLEKEYAFKDFISALTFTNKIGELAESQGHHPDIYLAWGKVKVQIWTHKIDGLHENDFILAAKIDKIKK